MDDASEREIALIEAYLHHKLDPYQSLQVRKRIEKDKTFAQKVLLYQNITQNNMTLGGQDSEDQWENEELISSNFNWWPLLVGGVLLIIVFGVLYWPSEESPENLPLKYFTDHFEPYKDIISDNVTSESRDIKKGFDFYHKQQYDSAAIALERYLENIPDRTVEFYLALSYLADNQDTKALEYLKKLATDASFILQPSAQWYYTLALIKTSHLQEAQVLLKEMIAAAYHPHEVEARKLHQALVENPK